MQINLKPRPTVALRPGDLVKVHYKIREGGKERLQLFEGLVIAVKKPKTLSGSLTVRRVIEGIGVERTFPFASPYLAKVERLKTGKVRRAKLYFVRHTRDSRLLKLKGERAKDELAVAIAPAVAAESSSEDNMADEEPSPEVGGEGGNAGDKASPEAGSDHSGEESGDEAGRD